MPWEERGEGEKQPLELAVWQVWQVVGRIMESRENWKAATTKGVVVGRSWDLGFVVGVNTRAGAVRTQRRICRNGRREDRARKFSSVRYRLLRCAAAASSESHEPQSTISDSLGLLDWPQITKRVRDMACTECGREILGEFMPLADSVDEARVLLSETREAIILENSDVGLDFSGAGDIERSAELASRGSMLSGKDLITIADTLLAMRKNKRVIEGFSDSITLEALEAIVRGMSTKAELEQEIRRCLDGEGRVRDSASTALLEIRNSMKDIQTLVMSELNAVMSKKREALQDRIITQRFDRFVLAVKAGQKSKVPGIVHDASATGQTLYIEPREVSELNNKIRVLAKKEKAEIERILTALSELVGLEAEELETIQYSLMKLDFAQARARHSLTLDGVEPKFVTAENTDDYLVELRGAKHPLLMWQEIDAARNGQDHNQIVPSDYLMFSGTKCAIVTGPNTGGKTVCLKNLGIAVLMAKAGLFVCAEGASFPFFDRVLADIGDDQSIVQSLSTFSGHVRRMKLILAEATSSSLVLLDEVGSGTDPTEGSALGMSLLRTLVDRVQLVMATTHHGELKTLKYSDAQGRFENASVQFDDEKMCPTYKLIWGIPGRSNALAIASRLGLETNIIEGAQRFLSGTADEDANVVIAALEKQRADVELVQQRLKEKEREAKSLSEDLKARHASLERELREKREEMDQKLAQEFDAARQEVRQVVRAMQKSGESSKAAGAAREKLEKLSDDAARQSKEMVSSMDAADLKEGDLVRVARLGESPVKVVEPPSPKGEVLVQLGQMKLKVKVEELLPTDGAEVSSGQSGPRSSALPAKYQRRRGEKSLSKSKGKSTMVHIKTASNTVDIRGQRVEEALDNVRDTINSSFSFGSMWVIHGHGTGVLKASVREMLKKSKLVAKFEDAERLDGGSGATVAYFK